MQDILTRVVEDMRPTLEQAGVKVIKPVLGDKVDHAKLYDAVIGVRDDELAKYVQTRLLVSEETWAYYQARGITMLAECKLLRKAATRVRQAWDARVLTLVKESKDAS
jgi:hypothetical protein